MPEIGMAYTSCVGMQFATYVGESRGLNATAKVNKSNN